MRRRLSNPILAGCLGTLLGPATASACGACRPSIRALILTPDFPYRFASLLAPVAILLVIGVLVHTRKEKAHGPP
jgi:hypothetical protein